MKLKNVSLYFLLIGGIFSFSCKEKPEKNNIRQTQISFKKEGELKLFHQKTDSIVKQLDIEIADSEYERETGLMYRQSMRDSQGMLFVFQDYNPRWFYMKNTQIALDIIYLDKDQKIVSFQKNAQPMNETSLPSNKPAMYVLEVNAGLSDQWGLKVGDSISYIRN